MPNPQPRQYSTEKILKPSCENLEQDKDVHSQHLYST